MEKSISDLLLTHGIRHARDAQSETDSRHSLFGDEGFIGRFDAGEAVDLIEGKRAPLNGRDLYEADLIARPHYHDGTKRKTWQQLGDLERRSWERRAGLPS